MSCMDLVYFLKLIWKVNIIKLGWNNVMNGKSCFKMTYDLYEWLIIPFGLTNASNTFMQLMNHVLHVFIGKFIVVCFDDIIIYSKNLIDHAEHLCNVLDVLCWKQLHANRRKCTFLCMKKIVILSYIVSVQGI